MSPDHLGQRHRFGVVTVTYPVINYILRTLAYTLCLSDISSVFNCNNSQASLEDIILVFRSISCLYSHVEPTADVVTSLNQSASRKQHKETFPLRHILGMPF